MEQYNFKKVEATVSEIKETNMLFSCDYETAIAEGGPLTQKALEQVPEDWRDECIIDSRYHMLKKGWYPGIPGWHLDDIPRGEDGQPDFKSPERATHLMMLVDAGTGSLTEFLANDTYDQIHFLLPGKVPDGKSLWGKHNSIINEIVLDFQIEPVESGVMYEFDHRDYHRVAPAKGDGWRWFIRISINSRRQITNEIRKQVQVYLAEPEAGW